MLIHDGVRPFVKMKDIEKCINMADKCGACILGVPVKDTVKACNEAGEIISTPDRKTLWQAQTPQAFNYDLIMQAYDCADKEGFLGTDDASVAENYGIKVRMVEGSYDNIKITTPEDLLLGKVIIEKSKTEN